MDKSHAQKKPSQGTAMDWAKDSTAKTGCTTIAGDWGHGSGLALSYGFSGCLCRAGSGLQQFRHKDGGVFDLDMRGDAAIAPVVDALGAMTFKAQQLGHFGGSAQAVEDFVVAFDGAHGAILYQ